MKKDTKDAIEARSRIAAGTTDRILQRMLIPESEKNIEWGISTFFAIQNIIRRDGDSIESAQNQYREMHLRYNLEYGSNFDYVFQLDETSDLPVPFKFFPIIRNKVDHMVGEYLLRPEKRYCQTVDDESTSKRLEESYQLSFRNFMQNVDEDIDAAAGFSTVEENQSIPIVENIERYQKENPLDIEAEMMNDAMEYLIQVRKLKEKIKPLLIDYLLSQHCACEIIKDSGDPMPYRFAPDEYAFDMPASEEYLEKANWFYAEKWESLGFVLDRFREDIDEDDYGVLEKLNDSNYADTFFNLHGIKNHSTYLDNKGSVTRVRVSRVYFKSYKLQKAKSGTSKKGKEYFKLVGDDYGPRSYEKMDERLSDDPYMIYQIAGVFWLRFGKTKNQARSVDNWTECPLPIVGLAGNNNTGFNISFAQMLVPVEAIYNEVMYQIRYLIKQSGGKALIYDVSQMPKQFGGNFANVAKELKTNQIIPIDLSQEGNPKSSSFNQWKEIDFSLTTQITALWNTKMQIEKVADDISGVNEERSGSISAYSTNDIAQENIRRSSMRTEVWLMPFDNFYKRLLEKLVSFSKHIWPEGKKLQFWKGDGSEKILEINKEILLKDFAFSFESPYKQQQEIETLKQLSMQLMSSASAEDPRLILNYVKLLKADNYQEAERIFEEGVTVIEELKKQQQEQEASIAEQNSKAAVALEEKKAANKKIEIDSKEKIAKLNNDSAERRALILADEAEVKERAKILGNSLVKENDSSSPDAKSGNSKQKEAVSSAKQSLT
jgi:hypothetical protein